MAAPALQIGSNGVKVALFWDMDSSVNGGVYTIYYAAAKSGPYTKMVACPNVANYGKRCIELVFERALYGFQESSSFFIAGTFTPPSGAEGPQGTPRFIPGVVDQAVAVGAANSPLTISERFPTIVGDTPVRVVFSADAKQLEVFNYDASYPIFVDITGLDASTSESIPVAPMGYYALGSHIPKDSGISLISLGTSNDVRIVAHY